ncbi:hypothetical protein ACQ4PT_068486 [Festuca glaucescens]
MENKARHEPSNLPYKLLKQITNDFDKERILGSGSFGTVYKGVHENHGEIAVKVLHKITGVDDKEFHKEFDNLRGLKHPNVVELVGFCNESEEELVLFEGKQVTAERLRLALCFEYVQNGSLKKLISDENTGFTWQTRYRIIKGICEGLKYLREGLESPIMHFDLKPDNILLDKSMVPKIADFGLAKLFGEENTRKTMSPAGTCGYQPPEYIKHQILSREFDIFSLGVIIVKIITGHEGYSSTVEMTTQKAVKLVRESWKKRLRGKLSHASLEGYCYQVKRCIEIGLDCLKSNRQERPSIRDIVSSLNETERMISDTGMQNEQFYQDDGEFTLPSKIRSTPINHIPTSDLEPAAMSWGLLKEITDNFSRERLLGQGGYGTVYKGLYGDGQVIAVKNFYPELGMNDNVIEREIEIHRRVHHHPNIVQLVGYCYEEEEVVAEYNGKHVVALDIHRAVCFEHVGGGSLEQYITPDMSSTLDWQTQYRIIKGVCEGLRYLHEGMESHIIHMNLKPSKILLDDQKMVPKIGGFSLARLVGTEMTQVTMVTSGTLGYMPPEFIDKAIVTKGFDIYSLGVTILQLMTGREMYRKLYDMSSEKFIAMAHAKWRERLQKTVDGTSVEGYCQQVQKCLEIGVKCVERDRHKRPAIGDIIHVLNETEISIPQSRNGLDSEDSELLLEVYPMELCFQAAMSSEVARNKKASMMSSSCSLQLKNKANDRVAFMLVANSPKRYLTKEPLCGVVPPRCAYTLTHTMRNNKLSSDSGSVDFFTLYSAAVDEYDLVNVDKDSVFKKYDSFFKKAKEEVQEVTLKVICDQPAADRGTSSSEPTRPTFEIISTPDAKQVCFIDVHPTEPWIMTTNHAGSLRIWNYHTMKGKSDRNIDGLLIFLRGKDPVLIVHVAKFITREKWLVIGDRDGGILVYNYEEEEDVKSFDAHDSCITTLAVHPTSPFVLSSSEDDDHMIKLWDWGNGWKCTEFGGHTDRVMQVTVNPDNNDSFASASLDGTVKIWSICSDDPNNIITLKLAEHGLCADYFTRYNRQHLIVGCDDRSAQIWELTMKERVHELEGHDDRVTAVGLHPGLQILITGSLDGAVRIWNSTTYKLENIIGFNLGAVYGFGCIKGLRRIMVGCHQGIAMMKIDFP